MAEYFSDPNVDEFTITREEWQLLIKNSQIMSVQQLKAEIRAMCIELECTTHEKFDSGMYHALRGRLRELSAV